MPPRATGGGPPIAPVNPSSREAVWFLTVAPYNLGPTIRRLQRRTLGHGPRPQWGEARPCALSRRARKPMQGGDTNAQVCSTHSTGHHAQHHDARARRFGVADTCERRVRVRRDRRQDRPPDERRAVRLLGRKVGYWLSLPLRVLSEVQLCRKGALPLRVRTKPLAGARASRHPL